MKQTGGGFLKRTRAAAAAAGQGQGHVEERALTDAEVAQVLSILLNRVAGVIKLAEGLVGKVPILGDVLDPIFRQINGDIALILSSVKYLLVGVIGLVRDLVSSPCNATFLLLSCLLCMKQSCMLTCFLL